MRTRSIFSAVAVMVLLLPALSQADGPASDVFVPSVGPGGVDPAAQKNADPDASRITVIIRLKPAVEALMEHVPPNPEKRKATVSGLLSLMQAALEAEPTKGRPAILKLHEATETLVCVGNAGQRALIDAALAAVQPTHDELERFERQAVNDNIVRDRSAANELQRRLESSKYENNRLQTELMSLRSRADQLEAQVSDYRIRTASTQPAR